MANDEVFADLLDVNERLARLERRVRDLEIAVEMELPPIEGDPRG